MDDLALSLDRQNAENFSRSPELATSGRQQDHESRQLLLPSLQRSDISLASARISDHCFGDVNLAAKSLEDILRKFMPDDSDMALSLNNRKSSVMFMSTFGERLIPLGHEPNFDEVNFYRNSVSRPKGLGTLVIEDVNLKCYQKLCAKYPGVIDPAIFAEHIVRFDDLPVPHGNVRTINERLVTDYPDAVVNVNSSGNFMAIKMRGHYDHLDELHFGWKHGFHLDTRLEATHGEAQKHILKILGGLRRHGYRADAYERDAPSYWRRISCRITCFHLEAGFYLMLVDSPPGVGQIPEKLSGGTICLGYGLDPGLDPGIGSRIPRIPVRSHISGKSMGDVLNLVASLSEDHKLESIFDPRITPIAVWQRFNPRNRLNKYVFTCLLAETGWRRLVLRLGSHLQELQQEVTITTGAQAFEALTEVRRQLAGAKISRMEHPVRVAC